MRGRRSVGLEIPSPLVADGIRGDEGGVVVGEDGGHDASVMHEGHGEGLAGGSIPDHGRFIVAGRDDPVVGRGELGRSYLVSVPEPRSQGFASARIPNRC